jgi:hypothetical protein
MSLFLIRSRVVSTLRRWTRRIAANSALCIVLGFLANATSTPRSLPRDSCSLKKTSADVVTCNLILVN